MKTTTKQNLLKALETGKLVYFQGRNEYTLQIVQRIEREDGSGRSFNVYIKVPDVLAFEEFPVYVTTID